MADPNNKNQAGSKNKKPAPAGTGSERRAARSAANLKRAQQTQRIAITVIGIAAIGLVCLCVYLVGRSGSIRMNERASEIAAAAASDAARSTDVASPDGAAAAAQADTAVSAAVQAEKTAASGEENVNTGAEAAAAQAGEETLLAESAAEGTADAASEGGKKKKKAAASEENASGQAEAEAAASDQSEPEKLRTTYVVNVRSGPSTDTEVMDQLQAGAAVEVIGEEGEWSIIDYNGSKAYVKTEFLARSASYDMNWELDELDNEPVNFGYSQSNRDENNVPTDWEWYEAKWGQFNVDWIQDTSQNIIYLTMDEGFANDTTAGILDVLAEKDVKAVFFLTKYFVDEMPEMVQRMIDEGHQLGNHTCTHPKMPTLSIEEQTDQVMTLHNLVKDKFGYEMKYFRYPEGVYSNQSLGLINNLGYKAVFWSYAYNDYSDEQPPVDESLAKAVDAVHNGAVYLLHASSTTNAAFLADWIDACRDKGFEFGIYPDSAN